MELLWDMEDLKHPVSLDMEEAKIEGGNQILSLSSQVFTQLLELGLDANHLWLLENPDFELQSPKVLGWKQTLSRKGYIDEKGDLTKVGKELLLMVGQGKLLGVKKQKKEQRILTETSFDSWWKEYPATDTFSHKGKTFKGSRALRADKNDCMVKYGAILSRGIYTAEDMLNALKLEKKQKMELSVVDGVNKMKYFQNSRTYLSQGTYENYIQLIKDNPGILGENANNQGLTKRVDI